MTDYPPPQLGERYRRLTNSQTYIVTVAGDGGKRLINLRTGSAWAWNTVDPFEGDRAGFVRIDEHGKEIAPH